MDEIISSLSLQESEEDLEGDEEDLIVMRLVREIQEKDGQLQMAAEIGQTLLEKNEKLAEQVESLQDSSRQQELALEELQYRSNEQQQLLRYLEANSASQAEQAAAREAELRSQLDDLLQSQEESAIELRDKEKGLKSLESVLLSDELRAAKEITMSDEHEVTLTSPGGTRRQWDPDSPGVRESESADSELAQELARLRLEVRSARDEQAQTVQAQTDAMRRERLRSEKVIQQQTKLLDESTTEIADLRRELEQHTEEIRRLEAVVEKEQADAAEARVCLARASASEAHLAGEIDRMKRMDSSSNLDIQSAQEDSGVGASNGLELEMARADCEAAEAENQRLQKQLASNMEDSTAKINELQAQCDYFQAELKRTGPAHDHAKIAANDRTEPESELRVQLRSAVEEKNRMCAENSTLKAQLRDKVASSLQNPAQHPSHLLLRSSSAEHDTTVAQRKQNIRASKEVHVVPVAPLLPSISPPLPSSTPPLPSSTPPLPSSTPPQAGTWFALNTASDEPADAGRPSSARAVADGLISFGVSRTKTVATTMSTAANTVTGGRSTAVATQGLDALTGGAHEVGRALWKKVQKATEAVKEIDAETAAKTCLVEQKPTTQHATSTFQDSRPTMDADVHRMASKLQDLQQGMREKQKLKRAAAAQQQQRALDDLRSATSNEVQQVNDAAPESTSARKQKSMSDTIVSDPLFQFFYLTAQSHKVNNPLLAEMKLSPEDLVSLFKRVSEQEQLMFNEWSNWLLQQMTRLSMANSYKPSSYNPLRRRETVLAPAEKRILLAGDIFTSYVQGRLGIKKRLNLVRLSPDLSKLTLLVVAETEDVMLEAYDTVIDGDEALRVPSTDRLRQKIAPEDYDKFFLLAGHGVDGTLDMLAPTVEAKETWIRALRKLFHANELYKAIRGPTNSDDLMLSTMSAAQRAKIVTPANSNPSSSITKEQRKTLSLAVGSEYRLLQKTVLYSTSSFSSTILGDRLAGDIVKIVDLGFADDPNAPPGEQGVTRVKIAEADQKNGGWMTFGPQFLEPMGLKGLDSKFFAVAPTGHQGQQETMSTPDCNEDKKAAVGALPAVARRDALRARAAAGMSKVAMVGVNTSSLNTSLLEVADSEGEQKKFKWRRKKK